VILLIDNYDSFTYNLYQYIEVLGFHCEVRRNDEITVEEIAIMAPEKIVISPGPGSPDSAGISLELIQTFAGRIPVLGVCLGHQAIGQAFGAKVVRASKVRHGKVSEIFHGGEGLFAGIASPFTATRYHSLVIERETIPDCLQITAETLDGVIMGIRHRDLPIEGVQFHPESIATEYGLDLMNGFLKASGE
jgi:para-aminobenzoate synthetase component 2